MPPTSPEHWTPDTLPRDLGPYRLTGVLGEGGTARVFDAHLIGPQGFEWPVALKVLKRDSTIPRAREMLLQEARLASLIRHPNVVDVYDLGEVGALPWIAMERVSGQTLKRVLRDGALTPATGLDLLQQIAAGLSALHDVHLADRQQAAVVHRDLKPANVIIDSTGRVRLVDFGIAVLADPDSNSDAWGTLAYMSPEQATGDPVEATSDVFSFGALVYEVLVGRKLWPGKKPSHVIGALLKVEDRLARGDCLARVEAVLPGSGAVLGRCLRLEPADRWPHGGALWEALDRLRGPIDGPSELAARVAGPSPDRAPTLDAPLFPASELVGRAQDQAWLAGSSARLRTLVGPLGVGKSALAADTANRAVVAGGRRVRLAPLRTARSPSAALQQIADSIRVPRATLGSLAGGAWLLGEALANLGPVLLILDDADEALEGLAEWLPDWLSLAPGLRVLVTARRPLGLPDEAVRAVDLLSLDDAATLLAQRCEETLPPDVLRARAQRIGGLPLALELEAGALGASLPTGTGSDTTGDLPGRVRTSLKLAWQGLGLGARQVLSASSVFRDGFTLADAVAVLDSAQVPQAGSGLAVLGNRGLLRRRTGRAGSRLVLDQPLLRFAAEQLAEQPALQLRLHAAHAARYAQLGSDAAVAILSGPRAFELQVRWVDELENLRIGLVRSLDARAPETAAALGRALHEARVIGHGIDDLDALTRRLSALRGVDASARLRLDLSRARALADSPDARVCRDLLRTVIRRARTSEEPLILSEASVELARQEVGAARYDRAKALVDEALAVATASEHRGLQARALRLQAVLLRRQGRHREALVVLDRAERLCRALADVHYGTMVDALRALLRMDLGELGAAEALLTPVVDLLRTTPDRQGLARQLGNLALIQTRRGKLSAGRPLLEEALALYRGLGQLADATHAHQTLGSLSLEVGDLELSQAQYAQAVDYARRLSNRDHLATALVDQGLCMRHRGELVQARAAMEEGRAVAAGLGQHRQVALIDANLAELCLVEGRVDEGRALAEDLLTRPETRANPRLLGCVQGLAGDAARRAGELERAGVLLDLAVEALEGKDWAAWGMTLLWRARLDLERGRLGAARSALAEVRRFARAQGLKRRAPLRLAAAHLDRELARR